MKRLFTKLATLATAFLTARAGHYRHLLHPGER
jgi:hypothetical protein